METTKAFHESIIDAITNVTGPSQEAISKLVIYGDLILKTKIPENNIAISNKFEWAINYWTNHSQVQDLSGLVRKVREKLVMEM